MEGVVKEDNLYNGVRLRRRRKRRRRIERIIAPLIPNLDTRWRSTVNFTIRSLYSLGK